MTAQPEQRTPTRAAVKWQACFSSLGCPEKSLDAIVGLAEARGIPCLELRAVDGRTDLPRLFAESPGGWSGVRAMLERHGRTVRVLGTSFKLVGAPAGGWEELMAFAELAEALDVPWLRVFGGGVWGTELTAEDLDQAAAQWTRWAGERRARDWKVDLLVETHDAFSASAPCLDLMERVGGGVGLIWDSHHTWRLGGELPAVSWAALGPHVRHVHWKDSLGVASARHPFTYVLPGAGETPVTEVFRVLAEAGYDGAVSLEWEKLWHPYLPTLEEALDAAERLE